MPLTDNEKLMRFSDEVMSEADAEAAEILARVRSKYESSMEQGKLKIDSEVAVFLDNEMKKVRRASAQQITIANTKARGEILRFQEKLLSDISAEVKNRLDAFAHSEEYKDYLINLCRDVLAEQTVSFAIHLSENDANKYKYDILRTLDDYQAAHASFTEYSAPVYSVIPDKTIKIGGAKFISVEGGIFIDETLDENLNRQHERFAELVVPAMREIMQSDKH